MKIELHQNLSGPLWRGFHFDPYWFFIDLGLIGFDYYHPNREVVIRFWGWELDLYFKTR